MGAYFHELITTVLRAGSSFTLNRGHHCHFPNNNCVVDMVAWKATLSNPNSVWEEGPSTAACPHKLRRTVLIKRKFKSRLAMGVARQNDSMFCVQSRWHPHVPKQNLRTHGHLYLALCMCVCARKKTYGMCLFLPHNLDNQISCPAVVRVLTWAVRN